MALKAYRFRFYPTPAQKTVLAKTFGCCRYAYNWALSLKNSHYQTNRKSLSYNQLSAALTALKQEPDKGWLAEVSSVPVQQALRHLITAFKNFFEGRAERPTFKKKRSDQSATYMNNAFQWDEATVELKLAKMESPLSIRFSRPLPKGAKPSSVTVSMDSAGRYFVSLLVEESIRPKPVTPKMSGLDLGLLDSVITSHGQKSGNPRFFQKSAKKLAKAQRRLSRKQLGSRNREKARRKVARIHAKIKDRRTDFLHKLTTHLINENQIVAVESLAVKNLLKNRHLAKAIADVGWGELIRQLTYKAGWYGRTLVRIDRFFPSSKRCSRCGAVVESLPLEVRYWTCSGCGVTHDRDINSARNILGEGLRILAALKQSTDGQSGSKACGAPVRPKRAKPKGVKLSGQGAVKQEPSRSNPVEAAL
ncbi:MAG TPA: RNA-guided endonuclease TnpB family protein [Chloroflexia bacterium]|nr:RNA-guided endonuclease TnpB family protein [Chloroflexia bacterium]